MTKRIPVEKIDEFCDLMFRALDRAGLLPATMNKKSYAFEKYPRRLVGFLTQYDQIEPAYNEWYTSVLRGMHDSRRTRVKRDFEAIRDWLIHEDNRPTFEGDGKKDNLNHVRRSLYGRIFSWLYPRRHLALTYINPRKEDSTQFTVEYIDANFYSVIAELWDDYEGAIDDSALTDAQQYTIDSWRRYKKSANDNDLDEGE